jgi:hypothetical protein
MQAMQTRAEQLARPMTNKFCSAEKIARFPASDSLKMSCENGVQNHRQRTCDKASPAAAVMLHLRSCYVSKAAILPIPVSLVPVENRSPA